MLRGTLVSARDDECEAMTGARLVASAWYMVRSATCEMSTIMPMRFISRTTCRPKSVMPSWCCDRSCRQVAAGIAELVGVRPGQRHVAHAQAVVVAQHADIAFYGMAALDAHQRCQFMLRDAR